ncbi:MAG: hypothetical protein CFK48_08895 [Armatimonadetes bacterium CP1_7O]|nr:MAG: hypothetical protein CFK48_08895 [Armatimonadetes bacterium CP1_7O]RMH06353.1 MAG: hypothetical protein D6697_10820 [Armatimonadota bacterium]
MNRYRTVVLVLIVAFFGFLSGVALMETHALQRRSRIPESVDARRFRLLDQDGNVRAELGMPFGEPALFLYDSKGKARAWILLEREGNARIMFVDPEDQAVWTAPPTQNLQPKPE